MIEFNKKLFEKLKPKLSEYGFEVSDGDKDFKGFFVIYNYIVYQINIEERYENCLAFIFKGLSLFIAIGIDRYKRIENEPYSISLDAYNENPDYYVEFLFKYLIFKFEHHLKEIEMWKSYDKIPLQIREDKLKELIK